MANISGHQPLRFGALFNKGENVVLWGMEHGWAPKAGLLAALVVATGAWVSPAPDVVVYGEPMLDRALHDLAAAYTARSKVPAHVFDRPGAGLLGLLRHRARADVMVGGQAVVAAAVAEGLARPDPVAALGVDPFVFVARDDAAHATRLVVTDPTAAATFDGRAVLAGPVPAEPLLGASDTPDVVFLVAHSRALRGLVYRSDVVGVAHLVIAAGVAAPPTPIAAALVSGGQSRNAGDFLTFMQTPAARAILRRDGIGAEP